MEQKEEEKGHEISISHWLLLEREKETVRGKGEKRRGGNVAHFLGNTVKKVFLFKVPFPFPGERNPEVFHSTLSQTRDGEGRKKLPPIPFPSFLRIPSQMGKWRVWSSRSDGCWIAPGTNWEKEEGKKLRLRFPLK